MMFWPYRYPINFYEWIENYLEIALRNASKHETREKWKAEYFIPLENKLVQVMKKQSSRKQSMQKYRQSFRHSGIRKIKLIQSFPEYRMDNFVEGDCNKLARAAGIAIAKKPGGTAFNPLFIYGSVGFVKPILLQAIENEVLRLHPDKNVMYTNAEKFTKLVIGSLKIMLSMICISLIIWMFWFWMIFNSWQIGPKPRKYSFISLIKCTRWVSNWLFPATTPKDLVDIEERLFHDLNGPQYRSE